MKKNIAAFFTILLFQSCIEPCRIKNTNTIYNTTGSIVKIKYFYNSIVDSFNVLINQELKTEDILNSYQYKESDSIYIIFGDKKIRKYKNNVSNLCDDIILSERNPLCVKNYNLINTNKCNTKSQYIISGADYAAADTIR
jgi:hypothetical protein